MKRFSIVAGLALFFASGSAMALDDDFGFYFTCYDSGQTIESIEMHEHLSDQTHFQSQDVDCDTVCLVLMDMDGDSYDESDMHAGSMSIRRYQGDLTSSTGGWSQLSNYGLPDQIVAMSGHQTKYCWADWTNDYWATYYNSVSDALRKTVVTFQDDHGTSHTLSLVPAM